MAYYSYLELDGVTGESKAEGMEGKIEVMSFSFGTTNPCTIQGGGLSGGKVDISDLSIMKRSDKASPVLFKKSSAGTMIKNGKLYIRKQSGDKQENYIIYSFEPVFITSVRHSGSAGGDETPTESLSLAFNKISYEYKLQNSEGVLETVATWEYDRTTTKTAT